MNLEQGDVGYIDKSVPPYVENPGNTDLAFIDVYPTPPYQDISVAGSY
jgi:oxalate decarboxylase